MKHIKWPSIEQYRNAIRNITNYTRYSGKDENGDPIYNTNPLPKLTYIGTVKSHGCFSHDTLITLADGNKIPISEITKDTSILSFDLDKNMYVVEKVNDVIVQELDKNWIKLEFDNGSIIECTEDHKFYTKNRGWVEAKNLIDTDEFILDVDE